MKGKAIIPLVAGLCVGGLALKIGWSTLQKAQGAQPELAQAWASKEPLSRGVPITEAMLSSLKFPAQYLPPGSVKKKEDLVGRVPAMEAPAGLPIVESMLHPRGTPPGIFVPPGLRAVAVKIDESSGVDYHIEPGAHVDVVGYFMTRRDSKQEIVARTLIENVEVAAVGQKLQPGAGEQTDKSGKAKPARAVTLLVKPEFVPKLHLAEQRGKIKLSLRNEIESDGDRVATNTTEDDILGAPPPKQGNVMDQLTALFARRNSAGDSADAAARARAEAERLAAEQAAALPPPPAWVMSVWNGEDRQRLGWARMDSIEAMLLDAESDMRGTRRAKRAPLGSPIDPNQSSAPTTEKKEDNSAQAEPDPEPEELPE